MKILHTVEFYWPSVGGAQEVVKQLSERMVAQGHDVTVATTKLPNRQSTLIKGVKIVEFEVKGNQVNGITGEAERYRQFLIESDFDIVMNYAAQEWTADLFFEVMDRVKGKKVFVPCGFSGLHDPAYQEYFKKLPAILKKYDATVYMSNTYQDRQFARDHGIKNTVLIPNGADEREFEKLDRGQGEKFRRRYAIKNLLIITIGNHTGEKGHRKSILAFALAPFRNGSLAIIGRAIHAGDCLADCTKLANWVNRFSWLTGKRVYLLDLPRPEVLEALAAADLFLFLSNIECSPLVLYEAAAAGVPFIATDAGNAREIADWTGGGRIVKSYPGLLGRIRPKLGSTIKTLTSLARSPKLRQQLGQSARTAWEHKYTWDKLTKQYLDLYRRLLHG